MTMMIIMMLMMLMMLMMMMLMMMMMMMMLNVCWVRVPWKIMFVHKMYGSEVTMFY